MISEVDNILKGRVESTVEYEAAKKIIGISQANLTPGEDGVVPLAKQNAFETETIEEEVVALETLDFSSDVKPADETSSIEQSSIPGLKEPELSDVAVDAPLEVTSPKELSGLNMTASSEVIEKPQASEPVEEVSGTIDIQMPQMPDKIVGLEPTEVDSNLFELPKQDNPSYEIPSDVKEEVPATIAPVEPQLNEPQKPATEQALNDIDTLINEKQKTFIEEMDKRIKSHLDEIKELYAKARSMQQESQQQAISNAPAEDTNPLMSDALAQINNMVIPSEVSGPKL